MDQSSSGFEVGDSKTALKELLGILLHQHSWLKIAELCVQASLSGFGLPFSELYELHALVVFGKLEVIQFHVVMFLPATETKMLSKCPPHCVH